MYQRLEAADCNSGKKVWRRSRIRGEEVDLNHNKHGSDKMRESTSCQRRITHGKRSERISIFAILPKLQTIIPLLCGKNWYGLVCRQWKVVKWLSQMACGIEESRRVGLYFSTTAYWVTWSTSFEPSELHGFHLLKAENNSHLQE